MKTKFRPTLIALLAAFSFAATAAPAAQAAPIRAGRVTAGSTGHGPGQASCNIYAHIINVLDNQVADGLATGNIQGAGAAADASNHVEDQALDAGCFIVHA